MATKKQKREAALARRQEFEAKERQQGLEAQRKDRERRAARAERDKEEAEKAKRKAKNILVTRTIHGDVERDLADVTS